MTSLAELSTSREMLVNLTLRELRGKYKRSLLGWSWSLLNPLATMLIFTLVFRYILKIPVEAGHPSGMKIFAFFLLCGLLPWNFMAAGMTGAMGTLIANANLIKKVYFPREILVVANVLASMVSLLIELAVLAVALMLFGNIVLPWLPMVIVLVALQTLFVIGIGLLMSVLNVYFRDVQHFVSILLQLWFYATPIIYPLSLVHDASFHGHRVPLDVHLPAEPDGRLRGGHARLPLQPALPARRRARLPGGRGPGHPGLGHRRLHQARAQAGRGAVSAPAPPADRAPAVVVEGVSKTFRLYHERNQSLKVALLRRRRATLRGAVGAARRQLQCPPGPDVRPHRRERLGQEHPAQVHRPHPAARVGADRRCGARCRPCSSWGPASTPSCRAATTSSSTGRSWG